MDEPTTPAPATWRKPWTLRPAPITVLVLIGLVGVGLLGGFVARAVGQSVETAFLIGVGVAFVAEVLFFAVPVRRSIERTFVLPANPDRVFALATDPAVSVRLNPMHPRLAEMTGQSGEVGSTFTLVLGGLTMVTRVISAQRPREIVTETRSRLNHFVISRRYSPVPGGTEVWIKSEQRRPLGAWLLSSVYRAGVQSAAMEVERGLRAELASPEP